MTTRLRISRKDSNNVTVQAIRRKDFYAINFMKWLQKIKPEHGYYIAGFADGEGSFNVSLKRRKDYNKQWKIAASFNISQKDRVILAWIKKVLGCGTLRERKDGVVYYEVTNISSLHDTIIPFFKKFRFLSANKKRNFAIFSSIVEIMYNRKHMDPEGFKEILELRERLNLGIGRKRKYTLQDVLNT
jgi:hypothetical protein